MTGIELLFDCIALDTLRLVSEMGLADYGAVVPFLHGDRWFGWSFVVDVGRPEPWRTKTRRFQGACRTVPARATCSD